MKNAKWKDFLLKSGVPLEYEVKQVLDSFECISSYEQKYLRKDEQGLTKEFSYDIDAAYNIDSHFFSLMIECKYRDDSTDWIFVPEEFVDYSNKMANCTILHPNDFFTTENKSDLPWVEMPFFAPICEKGIELTSDGQNPKSITQALSQLSFAFAENMVNAMGAQLADTNFEDYIFYHVPIIVTTANLYRLKENTTIDQIRTSTVIDEIATKETYVILNCTKSRELEEHSLKEFNKLIEKFGTNLLNRRMDKRYRDLTDMFKAIAKHICPNAVLIVQHNEKNSGFEKLFELFEKITKLQV